MLVDAVTWCWRKLFREAIGPLGEALVNAWAVGEAETEADADAADLLGLVVLLLLGVVVVVVAVVEEVVVEVVVMVVDVVVEFRLTTGPAGEAKAESEPEATAGEVAEVVALKGTCLASRPAVEGGAGAAF